MGKRGNQLRVFNSRSGPFPPKPGTEGHIAIGWPAIGDLRMWKDDYDDYVEKFRVLYKARKESEQKFMTKANMPWSFAFVMKKGDSIISPSSSERVLLVGKITGDYWADWADDLDLAGKKRADFVHVREVEWTHVLSNTDPRHIKLNRVGQLTISQQQHITSADLQTILRQDRPAA